VLRIGRVSEAGRVVFEDVVDQPVDPLPAGLRFHGYHRRAERDGPGDQFIGRIFAEDCHRRASHGPGAVFL
jgi:hypothetical protein